MGNELFDLEAEVARFQAWADEHYPDGERRPADYEGEYPDRFTLDDAFDAFIASVPPHQWSIATTDLLLFALARDNDFDHRAQQVAKYPESLRSLAEQAAVSGQPDAKWQLAKHLGRLDPPPAWAEPILLRFVHDEDNYVRRIALMALGDIGSAHVEELVTREWETGDEHQRMGVLYALAKIGSPKLEHYLELAEADGRPYRTQYVEAIRAGQLGQ